MRLSFPPTEILARLCLPSFSASCTSQNGMYFWDLVTSLERGYMKIEAHAEFTLEGCAAAAEVQDALGLGPVDWVVALATAWHAVLGAWRRYWEVLIRIAARE